MRAAILLASVEPWTLPLLSTRVLRVATVSIWWSSALVVHDNPLQARRHGRDNGRDQAVFVAVAVCCHRDWGVSYTR